MQSTAQGYLIYDMTKSKAYLGHVGLATGLPTWLFMLYAGVVADRIGRRKMMIAAQLVMMFQSALLTYLTYQQIIQPWHILCLAFTLGVANSFDAPARQSFILEMVDRKDLSNAIAINSSLFNLAAVIGPALAGVSYVFLGATGCFAINTCSFFAVIFALLSMRLVPSSQKKDIETRTFSLHHSIQETLKDFQEALEFVKKDSLTKSVLFWVSWISLFGICYMTLLPAWAVEVLHGGARASGLLNSYRAVGAVCAALFIAWTGPVWNLSYVVRKSLMIVPSLLLLLFAWSQQTWACYLLVTLMGMAFMVVYNTANTIVQMRVPNHLRGRVMAIYAFTFFGVTPLGAYWIGDLAEYTNLGFVITLSSLLTFIFYLIPPSRSLRFFLNNPQESLQQQKSRPYYSHHY
jgi:MFS family permease